MIHRYLLIGSLLGAAGVGLSAVAAHIEGARGLQNAALIMIIHGTLIVSIALHGTLTIPLRLGTAALAFGTVLFGCDIAVHTLKGHHLFTNAAPIGGSSMITGWLILSLGALFRSRS